MSADGKIALPNRKQIRLSNSQDLERVNKLRHECDAILVGIGTVIEDNPNLTIKNNTEQIMNPIRVILDTNGRTPLNSNVLNDEAETIIAVGKNCKKNELGNAEIIKCGEKLVDIETLMNILEHACHKAAFNFFSVVCKIFPSLDPCGIHKFHMAKIMK